MIERVVGAGGMGDVYRARDQRTGEVVALKLLRWPDAQLVARFQQEARLLDGLRHPAIARHVAHGVTDRGQHFLAMEWLEGEDLAARLARGPLDPDEALALVHRVAAALSLVHARGVIHRDLKPANLFLPGGRLDRVKILDFGIARDMKATGGITDPGAPIGTPAYMAPEQVRGELDIDARADLYALGCVLFECVTGQPPFRGDHPFAVLAKVLFEEAPPPSALRPGVPAAMDLLAARLMAKEREHRPESAAAAARELLAAAAGGAAAGRPPPALTRRERELVSVVLASVTPAVLASTLPAAPSGAAAPNAPDKEEEAPSPALPLADLRRAAARHGGRLEPLPDGGGVVVILDATTPTDLAARAVRCALALRKVLSFARIVVATGWDALDGGRPVGPVIDRAGMLLAGSGPVGGGPSALDAAPVQVDPITASLLGPGFEITQHAGAAEVLGEREPFDEARMLFGKPTPFIGRERELRVLEDLFDECVSERCARVGLVVAPAGMGKSRLRLELVRRLRARPEPTEIWIAQADPSRAGAPFDLLGQIVRRAAHLVDSEPLERRRERLAARVARHVDEAVRERVTEFLGEMVGAPFPDEQRVQLRAARNDPLLMGDQIRRAWVDFVDAECRVGPVLIILEDLHWGDLPTVDCIDAALRLLEERPLMVLGVARPEVQETFPALWAQRGTMELGLGKLPRRVCEQMVRAALGERISATLVEEIVRRAAGNAFFVEELVRAAAEGRDAREAPETVLAMVQARLKDLDAEARRLLRAGSVLGEVFWRGAVARLLGQEADAALDERLADLQQREWIMRRPEPRFASEVEYAFRHGLVREAAYGMLTDVDRRLGHRLAGAWLEEAGERDALVLAEHFEQGGAIETAAQYYERAAEQALEASDLDGVLARVDRALTCAPAADAAARLHGLAATAHNWRGAFVASERSAKAAVALSPGDSRAGLAARAMLAWASGALGKAEQLEALAAALPVGRKEVALTRELVHAWYSTAAWLRELGRHAAAAAIERGIADVQPEDLEPGLAGHIYTMRTFEASWPPRRLDLALRLTEAAFHAYERDGALRHACLARTNVGVYRQRLGDYGRAKVDFQEARRDAVRLGLSYVANAASINLAYIHVAEEQSTAARALSAAVIEDARAFSNSRQMGQARVTLARALLHLGEVTQAREEAERALGETEAYPGLQASAHATLARCLLREGRAEEALAAARNGFMIVERLGGLDEDEAFVRLTWAEVLHASGDRDAARQVLAAAVHQLRAEADAIECPALRRSFLEAVPEHAGMLALAAAWGVGDRTQA